jgi:hypothetical protein
MAGRITTIEGGTGAIKKRMAQIKKRMAQWPATKVSMMGAVDNGAWKDATTNHQWEG